ncbi:MAG: hypothetical protein ACT6FD_02115 [Methanosarcinaceae archaeon]
MLHIVNLEEIQNILLQVPELVNCLEKHDTNFTDLVKEWLTQAEQVLVNNRLPIAADVAVLRGVLISAERGVLPIGMEIIGRNTRRKVKDGAAAEVLRKTDEIISHEISGYASQVQEGERLARQLVALARQKGMIPASSGASNRTGMLNAIWGAMSKDTELEAGTTHLAGLVGKYDALILIDRMLPANI